MKRLSVKIKITLWYTCLLIVVSLIATTAVNSISRDMVSRDITSRIISVVSETSKIIVGRDGQLRKLQNFRYFERGVHLAIYDSEFNLLSDQQPFGMTRKFDFADNEVRSFSYDGNTYYEFDKQISHPFSAAGYWVKGVMSVSQEYHAIDSVVKNNIILTVILILFAAIGGYLIIWRALVPVSKITATAKEITNSSDLSRRINLPSSKDRDEIHALAATFDEMLSKIEQTFEREKRFTSDASHELRTPVAVILSECEYMKTCANTVEEYEESVDSVKRQADKMSKLISELLTISRMDRNTIQTNFEKTDISELLSFVCDEQEEIHTNYTLTRSIEDGIFAKVDRFLIMRLFINLISNAYQYSEENTEITVSLTSSDNSVIFSVTDHGLGICEEDLPKIWERFYQADTSRTANENGSMGLGLSMVKWIAETHCGKMNVESIPGEGSTFTFTFPTNCK